LEQQHKPPDTVMKEKSLPYIRDYLILCLIVIAMCTGTIGYFLLFLDASGATHLIAKVGLFVAAFLATVYSIITFFLCVILPLSHIFEAIRERN